MLNQEAFDALKLRDKCNFPSRHAVHGEKVVPVDDVQIPKVVKTPAQMEKIVSCLSHEDVLHGMLNHSSQLTQLLAEVFEIEEHPQGRQLFAYGDELADKFYIVSKGIVKLKVPQSAGGARKESKEVPQRAVSGLSESRRTLYKSVVNKNPGDSFGAASLLYGAPRSASAFAETEVELLTLRRQTLQAILMKDRANSLDHYISFMDEVEGLDSLSVLLGATLLFHRLLRTP